MSEGPPDPVAPDPVAPDPVAPDPVAEETSADEPLQSVRARKARDAGLILPLVGLAALMPPLGPVFAIEGTVLGVPLIVAYVFTVWAGLIVAAAVLGSRLAAAWSQHPQG